MLDQRPFLLVAHYNWIVESGMTPYIYVNCNHQGVRVPVNLVSPENTIILNIGMGAVSMLSFEDELITFEARFNGRIEHICVPFRSIMSIYAKEDNGVGMMLYSPEESSEHITSDVQIDPQPLVQEVAIPERPKTPLALVSNGYSGGEVNTTQRRAKLTLVK